MTTDEALLGGLAAAFETVDPVPLAAYRVAVDGLAWRDPDTALAELVADSLLTATAARSRPASGPRLLTFTVGQLSVEVEVAEVGDTRSLLGQLVPPQPADIDVHWPDGTTSVTADQLGRFSVESVPAGLVSLVCQLRDAPHRVATSWVTL